MKLDLVKNGEIVTSVFEGGTINLGGLYVSPAFAGWSSGDYSLVEGVPEEPPTPDPKMVGVEYEDVMCSATAEDQHGLAAVLVAIQLQGSAFQPTRFHFSNGSTLVISLENWQDFASVWLPFRQSFFALEA